MLRLSRLISDGCIFQRNKEIRITGWTDGETIEVQLLAKENLLALAITKVAGGSFTAILPAMEVGGPYELQVSSGKVDDAINISDIYIGDVFQLVGQSNIEFPMSRVKESYPEEFDNPDIPLIRTFKVVEHREFHGPLSELETGEWKAVKAETLPDFSAVGYFMAKKLYTETGIPVGLIDTTLGGSTIESWMSAEMLADFPEQKKIAETYRDDAYLEKVLRENEENATAWHAWIDEHDAGIAQRWHHESYPDAWDDITLPCIFKNDPRLNGFTGSIWLKRTFSIDGTKTGKQALLWFGTMTDSDEIFINGTSVGKTDYCYPPRRYEIPAGLLKEGENDITVRLLVEKGTGRVTDGKVYGILFGNGKRVTDGFTEQAEGFEVIRLDGAWKYRIGTRSEKIQPTDFVSWKPTALYNGMLYGCTFFNIGGLMFYQGEGNILVTDIYPDEFKTMVNGYRKLWRDEDLPIVYVQLPEFDLVTYEPDGTDEVNTYWENMQKCQETCADLPKVTMIKTIGSGEQNDLHPQRKKGIGVDAALAMMKYANRG
ncbi:MAG: hypothetical protein IK078_07175 [Lachnospiraceae bacterium]|nr:hypothetical protein [Lachnospiraceae bacterium]